MTKVLTVVGTRPEVIRLSRVIARLDESVDHVLVHTGQNYDYSLNQLFFDEMEIRPPDHYLAVDTSSLGAVLGGTLVAIERVLQQERPDAVLILGDTDSSIAAVMAKRMRIPIYHMEAGNRCFDENVPEETNRRLVDHVADFNLVYTEHARRNLLSEGIAAQRILLTGSPMFEVLAHHRAEIADSTIMGEVELLRGRFFLVSAHRQENVDDPSRLERLLECLDAVAREWDFPVLVSTHPRTQKRLKALERSNITGKLMFHEPFGFFDYNHLQTQAACVLSDSGTVSEESAILGFPAVTLRRAIERPEALDAGILITTDLEPRVVIEAVRFSMDSARRGEPPPEYRIANCADRVVGWILGSHASYPELTGLRRLVRP